MSARTRFERTCLSAAKGAWMQAKDAGSQRGEGCRFDARSLTRLERGDVFEIIDVEEDAHAGQAELQLPLDHGRLILARAPHVGEEEVKLAPRRERQLG